MVQIIVTDNGCGIHPEDLHHIFKRFYRSRFSKDTQGIGLGLPLAKAIIEAHDGTVEVDSEFGMGTRFTMNFWVSAKSQNISGRACRHCLNLYAYTPFPNPAFSFEIINSTCMFSCFYMAGIQISTPASFIFLPVIHRHSASPGIRPISHSPLFLLFHSFG